MSNQQKEKKHLPNLSGEVSVWISEEDKRTADAFLLKQKLREEKVEEDKNKPIVTTEASKSKTLENAGTQAVYTCDYCKKEFSRSSHLNRHVPVHTGQKGYHCNLCDYSCSQKSYLGKHICRHLKERPFKCPDSNCGADFTTSSHLKQHQPIHNKNDKRFSCSFCPYKSYQKSGLTQHMKNIHSESRPFRCQHANCEYACKRKRDLQTHSTIHYEEKFEVCPHPNCGYITKWSANLKIHMKIHSNKEKSFNCSFCEYSCHQHVDFIAHILHHAGQTPFS